MARWTPGRIWLWTCGGFPNHTTQLQETFFQRIHSKVLSGRRLCSGSILLWSLPKISLLLAIIFVFRLWNRHELMHCKGFTSTTLLNEHETINRDPFFIIRFASSLILTLLVEDILILFSSLVAHSQNLHARRGCTGYFESPAPCSGRDSRLVPQPCAIPFGKSLSKLNAVHMHHPDLEILIIMVRIPLCIGLRTHEAKLLTSLSQLHHAHVESAFPLFFESMHYLAKCTITSLDIRECKVFSNHVVAISNVKRHMSPQGLDAIVHLRTRVRQAGLMVQPAYRVLCIQITQIIG